MAKTKLNQIVAVVSGKKTEVKNALTALYQRLKPDLFNGLVRTYAPRDEDGETYPNENKPVTLNTTQVVDEFKENMGTLLDVVATQDYNNGDAKADVIVDGKVVLSQVPVTYLLFLEKQLVDFETFVGKLPTLDVGENWRFDDNKDLYVGDVTKSNKTKKELRFKVLYEATTQHPAQIEKWNEDVTVGEWSSTKLSTAMPAKDKKALVVKLKKLQDAVKYAREQANSMEVDQVKVAESVFAYLF